MTVIVQGRTYDVEATGRDRIPYTLTGPRGAVYWACRNVNHPEQLFLMNGRGRRNAPDAWLRELEPGVLEEIR